MSQCAICDGTAVFYCPICYARIILHSHEGDCVCDEHDVVTPVSEAALKALKARLATLPEPQP